MGGVLRPVYCVSGYNCKELRRRGAGKGALSGSELQQRLKREGMFPFRTEGQVNMELILKRKHRKQGMKGEAIYVPLLQQPLPEKPDAV